MIDRCYYEAMGTYRDGKIALDDIYDFINRRAEELMSTSDFKKICDKYFGSFIDIKDLNRLCTAEKRIED